MNLASILVIVSTCISGGLQENSIANLVDYVYESADQILIDAIEELDFDSFSSLSSSDQEIAIKEAMLEFNKDYYLIDDDVALVLSNSIDEDKISNYDDLDNLGDNNGSSSGGYINTDLGQSNNSFNDYISSFDDLFTDNDLGYLYEDPSRNEGAGYHVIIDDDLLPIYDIGDVDMTLNVNGITDEYVFIGLGAPAETCIAFYNIVSSYLNSLVMNTANQTGSIASYIINYVKTYAVSGVLLVAANALSSAFSSLWSSFIALVSAGGVGVILAIVAIVLAIGVIVFMMAMFIRGYQKRGFEIGWRAYSLFNWEFVCE